MTVKKDLKNIEKKEVIDNLYSAYRENKKNIYKTVAETINGSTRKNIAVNLSKLHKLKNVKEDSIVIIPGKLLGTGSTTKKIKVYAYSYSKAAKEKLISVKTLKDFCKDKIDYNKLVIIK